MQALNKLAFSPCCRLTEICSALNVDSSTTGEILYSFYELCRIPIIPAVALGQQIAPGEVEHVPMFAA